MKIEDMDLVGKQKVEAFLLKLTDRLFEVGHSEIGRILNYLFVLNAGGIVALLTYCIPSKFNIGFTLSGLFFFIGIVLVVLRATIAHYQLLGLMVALEDLYSSFVNNRIEYEDILAKLTAVIKKHNGWQEKLSWFAGIAFLIGVFWGGVGLYKSEKQYSNIPTTQPQNIVRSSS